MLGLLGVKSIRRWDAFRVADWNPERGPRLFQPKETATVGSVDARWRRRGRGYAEQTSQYVCVEHPVDLLKASCSNLSALAAAPWKEPTLSLITRLPLFLYSVTRPASAPTADALRLLRPVGPRLNASQISRGGCTQSLLGL